MRIYDFDINKGIYSFEFNNLYTENHAHPVVEIINAIEGSFILEVEGIKKENLDFAIIDSNTTHKVESTKSKVEILMLESNNRLLEEFLQKNKIELVNDVFCETSSSNKNQLFTKFKKFAASVNLKCPTDERINNCMRFMEENDLEYKNLMSSLTSLVYLSESRLSHLFKEHIGISIKKYLLWNKLKQAINLYLNSQSNFTDVSLQTGFFDQAHLSNSFKNILGVSPNKAYNSRILQS